MKLRSGLLGGKPAVGQALAPAAADSFEVCPGSGGRDDEAPVAGRGPPQLQRLLGLDEASAGCGDLVTLPLVPAAQLLM